MESDFKLNKMIIHLIDKESKAPAVIKYSKYENDVTKEETIFLLSELSNIFGSSINHGIFNQTSDTINSNFQDNFDKYIGNSKDEKKSFIDFTKEAVDNLSLLINNVNLSKGGNLIFADINKDNKNYFLIFLVRNKKGSELEYKDNQVVISSTTHVDLERIALACRINIDDYKANESRYISFISKTQTEIPKYFQNWIGFHREDINDQDTRTLRQILLNMEPPLDKNGKKMDQQDFMTKVYKACKSIGKINLKVLGESFWGDSDFITKYANDNKIIINNEFEYNEQELRSFTTFHFSANKINLSFPSAYLDKCIILDSKNPGNININSPELYDLILQELQ